MKNLVHLRLVALALLFIETRADNSTSSDTCGLEPVGPWSELLEEWATAPVFNERQGRIMVLPPASGYYVTDRVDVPPPPPPQHGPPIPYSPPDPLPTASQVHHGPPIPHSPKEPVPIASQAHHGPPIPHSPHDPVPTASQAQAPSKPHAYEEWADHPAPAAGHSKGSKIVNRPTKDKFKPSPSYPLTPQNQYTPSPTQHPSSHSQSQYQPSPSQYPQSPSQYQPHPPQYTQTPSQYPQSSSQNRPPSQHYSPGPSSQYHQPSNPNRGPGPAGPTHPVDRVDEPPRKTVTETDLYLLSAIEKLVYRVDLMEKRLRKLEENVHYFVAGHDKKPDPCVNNFTLVGDTCYHFSTESVDWKTANLACRKLRANLVEFDTEHERRTMTAAMLGDQRIRGMDVWTGGLNPGLLWIWSHSAKPINGSGSGSAHNTTATIVGEGRCLAFVHDPAFNNYVYRGQECSLRHRYICEKGEDKTRLSNEIDRVAKQLRGTAQHARQARNLLVDARRLNKTDTTSSL